MSRRPQQLDHTIDTQCTARFGPDGQICRGYCARLKVLRSLNDARSVYSSQGFEPKQNASLRIRGICVREDLIVRALSGLLPSSDRLARIRCGVRAHGELHVYKSSGKRTR